MIFGRKQKKMDTGEIILFVFIIAMLNLNGCQRNVVNEEGFINKEEQCEEEDMAKKHNYQNVLEYMMSSYGFDEEELKGIDIVRFAEDYKIFKFEYSKDEICKILERDGDMYIDDGSTELFSIFDYDEGGVLKTDTEICRIGFYRNAGTLVQRIVFDVEEKAFFADNAVPLALSDEDIKLLKEIPIKWGISEWSSYYEGKEESSTGSFRWKIVFAYMDGTVAAYGGYTGDMSNLPPNFTEVEKELLSIAKEESD